MQLQILGNNGKVLGAVTYSVSTHSSVPCAQRAAQRTQPQPRSQAQPESGQRGVCSPEDDCNDSSSSVAASHTASDGGQSLLEAHAATDADSDAAALQASTAFGTDVCTASKRDVSAALAQSQENTEAVPTSLDDDLHADSLIPSSSGMLLEMPVHCFVLQIGYFVTLRCNFAVWFIQLRGHSLPCLNKLWLNFESHPSCTIMHSKDSVLPLTQIARLHNSYKSKHW